MTMGATEERPAATEQARQHYNSRDARNLYDFVIGGETLNLGLYDDPPTRTIAQAMKKTTEWMAARAKGLNADCRVLDIGAGYGPAARYLARTHGCRVTCLNISEEQNVKNQTFNRQQGLDHLIDIVPGNFTAMPLDDAGFDLAWTQDALFHTDNLPRVMAETFRVLKPGGQFLLMDILQSDDCPDGALRTALNRVKIHHARIGSFRSYTEMAEALGFQCHEIIDVSGHLLVHYSKWREAVVDHYAHLSTICSSEFLELTKTGFDHWVAAAEQGLFKWGLFDFRRP